MATDLGNKVLVDVERYDQDSQPPLFNGRLSDQDIAKLLLGGDMNEKERHRLLIKLSGGIFAIPPRMIRAANEIKTGEITGIPQLGRTAVAASAKVDTIMGDILLGRKVESGRHKFDLRQGLGSEDDILKALSYIAKFLAAAIKQRNKRPR
jgi:hypothetical protein